MIEVFDSKNIFDLFYDCAEKYNCAYVYFYNKALENCKDESIINQVYEYYEEFLPEDLLLIIKTNQDNIIKFLTPDSARMNAASWFPTKEQLGNLPDEYYFKCYVIDSQGIIYYN
jgi:hypothetical protein